ncbi:MAG: AMP-binding protein, partial [Gammaproteobacteria bacterium]
MRPLHAFVESFAVSRPDAIAIVDRERRLSYAELNARANQLAHALTDRGAGPGRLVGLSVATGADTLVGMLGIMKSGAAYVPLDPLLPERRLQQIIAQCAPTLIVADEAGAAQVVNPAANIVSILEQHARTDDPGLDVGDAQLCYVMFTSGSTGRPKGVMVSHGNLAPLFDDIGGRLDIASDDVWTLFHTCAFGFSVWEIWGALLHGGRLIVVPPELRNDPRGFARLVRDEHVTVVSQTPSAFRQNFLADDVTRADFGPALRAIVLSGEAAVGEDVRAWYQRNPADGPALFNTYAITETSGQLTLHEYRPDRLADEYLRTIGRVLRHAEFLLLDEAGEPVDNGSPGELFVAGAAVAQGYFGEPSLTGERFVSLDVTGRGTVHAYRTGDRARL